MTELNKKAVSSAVDAIGRCKQCGSPVTQFNKVVGPTGMFCGDECKVNHEAFTQRAGSLERQTKGSFFGIPRFLGKAVGKLIVLAIIIVAIGVVGTIFEIPVLTPMVENFRTRFGF